MDALRFCDLIVVLLCEGRTALPKSMGSIVANRNETGLSTVDFVYPIMYFCLFKILNKNNQVVFVRRC